MVTVCIASFEAIGELQRKRLRQSCAMAFSWTDERVDNSYKQIIGCLCHSLIIVNTCRAWSTVGILHTQEKLTFLMEVSVVEQILPNCRNPGGTVHAQQCTRLFFPAHAQACEWGWLYTQVIFLKLLYLNIQLYYVKVHTHSRTIVLWACNTRETKKTVLQGTFLKNYYYCMFQLHFINNNSLYTYVHTCFDTIDLIRTKNNTMYKQNWY